MLDFDEVVIEDDSTNHQKLKPYKHSNGVYKFINKSELLEIYKHLNEPRIFGVRLEDKSKYLDKIEEDVHGVVFYWIEVDCGHLYIHIMKIIFGVKGGVK